MFPWLMPSATMGGNLSLLSMLYGGGAQNQSPYGNMFTDKDYWSKVNASRQPGEDNSSVFFRGLLPQSAWPQQWRDPRYGYQGDDRSDQNTRGNQPDTGNAMAPPDQNPQGGPDQNSSMSGYDPSVVSPSPAPAAPVSYGYTPAPWMQLLTGGAFGGKARNTNQRNNAMQQMGLLGLNMLQPRQQRAPTPFPWI